MFLKNLLNFQVALTVLLGLTCVFGDFLVDIFQETRVLKAFFDNITHGTVGSLSALIIVNEFKDKISPFEQTILILACFTVASIIDIDHFIQARSFNLKAATSLAARAFLHCTNITIVILFCFLIGTFFKSFRINIWISMFFCAFLTHHTRDATRRGFWIRPYGHTPPIPYFIYITMTMLTPHLIIYLLNIFKHRIDTTHRNNLMIV